MKKKVALVTGGYSNEAIVSYKSAINVKQAIESLFDVFMVDITPQGWTCKKDQEKVFIDKNDFSATINHKKIIFDFVYICIHGTPGEDGKLQSYFEMLSIPYIACNSGVSMLCYNKNYTKSFLKDKGVLVANEYFLLRNEVYDVNAINKLGLPLFVKPNTSGSSLGISKVTHWDGLEFAIQKAFLEECNEVLIEEFIPGREFTIGVYENIHGVSVLPITETISHNDFFDFEAKYEGKSDEITPADIPSTQTKILEECASKIYTTLQCKGIVRMEIIWHEKKQLPYFLEINTIPGFTSTSIVPQQINYLNISQGDFFNTIIQQSLK
ncbi:MAG: D-alanine--D-alanine ligase [Chitinophagaceae bacterium]